MEWSSPQQPPSTLASADVEQNRFVAALSWLWVLSIVILLIKKDSPYVQFHARQGFLVFLIGMILWVVFAFLGPFGWFFQWVLQTVLFVVIVVGFVQALRGKWWTIPVIGSLAPKIKL
ncbi:MAG: hypothetical protein G01um1014106_718 [Parcubacteria group bacterium Gr01-1014_106]|nr:MAG: hypothetical protein G01um1014106_718 [Parcubacteria group bacterium Gr01-1014_106]